MAATAMFGTFLTALLLSLGLLFVVGISNKQCHISPALFWYPILPLFLFGVYLTFIFWSRVLRIKDVSALEQIALTRTADVSAEFEGAWPTRVPIVKIAAAALAPDAPTEEERIFTVSGRNFSRIAGKGQVPVTLFLGPTKSQPRALQTESTLLYLTETSRDMLPQIHKRDLNQCIVSLLLFLYLLGPIACRPFEIPWLLAWPMIIQDEMNETPNSKQLWKNLADLSEHFGFEDFRTTFCFLAFANKLSDEGDYQQATDVISRCVQKRKEALTKKGITKDLSMALALANGSNDLAFQGKFAAADDLLRQARLWLPENAPATFPVKIIPGISVDIKQVQGPPVLTINDARHKRAERLPAQSESLYKKCLAEMPEGEAYNQLASTVWVELAQLHLQLGQTEKATQDLHKAISEYPADKCDDQQASHLRGHGWAELAEMPGVKPKEAEDYLKQALDVIKAEDARPTFAEAVAVATLGHQIAHTDRKAARSTIEACMHRWQESKSTEYVSYAVLLIAHAEVLEDEKSALKELDQAIKLCSTKVAAAEELAVSARHAAKIYRRQNNLAKALEQNQLAIDSYQRKAGYYAWPLAAALVESAKLAEEMNDTPRAEQLYQEAVKVCKNNLYTWGYQRDQSDALNACANFLDQKGDHQTASTLRKHATPANKQMNRSEFFHLSKA